MVWSRAMRRMERRKPLWTDRDEWRSNRRMIDDVHENKKELSTREDGALVDGCDVCGRWVFDVLFLAATRLFGSVAGVMSTDDRERVCSGKAGCSACVLF